MPSAPPRDVIDEARGGAGGPLPFHKRLVALQLILYEEEHITLGKALHC